MILNSIKSIVAGNYRWTLISLGLLNIFSIFYIFTFGGLFWRDFSIVFEGGLRILYGQIPYRDFFLPSGPVVYYMQALFHWILGANASAMLLHASVANIICLSFFFLYAKKNIGNIPALLLATLLHFLYYGAIANPWYSQTALLFFFLGQLILLNDIEKQNVIPLWKVIVSGLLLCTSIFSKQDFGMVGTAFIASQLMLFSKNNFKNTTIFLLFCVCPAILIVIFFVSVGDFGYWFNYGQEPHDSRIFRLIEQIRPESFFSGRGRSIIQPWRYQTNIMVHFIFIAPAVFLYLKNYNIRSLFILYMIIGLSMCDLVLGITSKTPPLSTKYFFLPLIGILFIRMILLKREVLNNVYNKNIIVLLISWVFLAYFSMMLPVRLTLYHYFIDYLPGTYRSLSNSSYSGVHFKPGVIKGIEEIKEELKNRKSSEEQNWFLNLSSYTFLYADLGVEPPRGVHLWHHYGKTMFDKDYAILKELIKRENFEYILVAPSWGDFFVAEIPGESNFIDGRSFKEFLNSNGYQAILKVWNEKTGTPKYPHKKFNTFWQHTLYRKKFG